MSESLALLHLLYFLVFLFRVLKIQTFGTLHHPLFSCDNSFSSKILFYSVGCYWLVSTAQNILGFLFPAFTMVEKVYNFRDISTCPTFCFSTPFGRGYPHCLSTFVYYVYHTAGQCSRESYDTFYVYACIQKCRGVLFICMSSCSLKASIASVSPDTFSSMIYIPTAKLREHKKKQHRSCERTASRRTHTS